MYYNHVEYIVGWSTVVFDCDLACHGPPTMLFLSRPAASSHLGYGPT
jgi:hypothetical protein